MTAMLISPGAVAPAAPGAGRMILRALGLALAAAPVAVPAAAQQVPPLACLFATPCAEPDCAPDRFTIDIAPIDHEPGLWFVSETRQTPVRDVTPPGASLQSFISQDADRRTVISVFRSGAALYTRHFQRPGRGPGVETAIGQCEGL